MITWVHLPFTVHHLQLLILNVSLIFILYTMGPRVHVYIYRYNSTWQYYIYHSLVIASSLFNAAIILLYCHSALFFLMGIVIQLILQAFIIIRCIALANVHHREALAMGEPRATAQTRPHPPITQDLIRRPLHIQK